jgi:hypothetical protein
MVDMDKKSGPKRTGGQGVQDAPSKASKADSGQTRVGSHKLNYRVNEQGEYCIGDECFQMRVKPGAGEVRVVIDRNECGTDAQQVIDALFGELTHGAPTVYETKSTKARQRQE